MASVFGAGSFSRSLNVSDQFARRDEGHGGGNRWPEPGHQKDALNSLIEAEIIPRLLSAHPLRDTIQSGADGLTIEPAEANRFASMPIELEADELLAEVETFLARGVPLDAILVDLLAPSARKLGEFWEQDRCDFVDVTMGLWRLQEVMRELTLRAPPMGDRFGESRTVLFSPMPGDQHSFGALMMDEVFTQAGWQSQVLIEPKRRELLQIVAERGFDLIGLTVTSDCPSGALADLITALRSVSKFPATQIFIGGSVVNANPGMVLAVGANGTAPDARSALTIADRNVVGSHRHTFRQG